MTHCSDENPRDNLAGIAASARMHLEMERSLGAEHLPFRPERVKELRGKRRAAAAAPAGPGAAEKAAELEKLRRELAPCCRCELPGGMDEVERTVVAELKQIPGVAADV